MKAMIFAAGLGTRLKPFTECHPKALAPVCGKPMLGLVIEKLKSFGITEIVINIHHFGEQVLEYLVANDNFGLTVHISDERDRLLDTGGGILAARQWLDCGEDFIVHNADILTDFNIATMALEHNASKNDATLLVAHRDTKRYLLFDAGDSHMRGWTNIETGQIKPNGLPLIECCDRLAFGGVHIVSPSVFPYLEEFAHEISGECVGSVPKFSIMDFYIANCGRLRFGGFQPAEPYRWHDIGKPQSLIEAERDFNQ